MTQFTDAQEAFIASWMESFEVQLRYCLSEYQVAFTVAPEVHELPTQIVDLTMAVGGWDHAIVPGSYLFMARQLDENESAYHERYRKWFHTNLRYKEFENSVRSLRGKRIAILGYPKSTIADIVKEWLDSH